MYIYICIAYHTVFPPSKGNARSVVAFGWRGARDCGRTRGGIPWKRGGKSQKKHFPPTNKTKKKKNVRLTRSLKSSYNSLTVLRIDSGKIVWTKNQDNLY